MPGAGLNVPLWILGSSLFGAQLAAHLGLPYAFASHFAPQMMMQAIDMYRSNFRPSAQLAEPYVMLGFNVFAADTDEEAHLLATSMQQAFVNLRTGNPGKLQPPVQRLPGSAGHARAHDARQRAVLLGHRFAATPWPPSCTRSSTRPEPDETDDHVADLRPRGAPAFVRDHGRHPAQQLIVET